MSLATRLTDLVTAVATDYKQLRSWTTGSSTGDLTGLTTTNKTSLIAAINEVRVNATGAPPASSETVAGVIEVATQAEVTAGTIDNRTITPLKLQQRLAAYAQPINATLTALAGTAVGAFGKTLLGTADATSAKSALGLAAVATSGNAADLTGTLGTAQLPALAINDTFPVATEAAMLALNAQRGDVAIRSDIKRSFILATEGAATLANWTQITSGGDVNSVAGKTGTVTLAKGDVGLGNVDNTSDASKPVSTAQAAADALSPLKANNLSDLTNIVTARSNLSVWSTVDIGNPETDLAAVYTAAKA
jgi:hypothetical protein